MAEPFLPPDTLARDVAALADSARKKVDEQLARLENAADVTESGAALRGVMKETAVLSAWSSREAAHTVMMSIEIMNMHAEHLALAVAKSSQQMDGRIKELADQISSFSDKADKGTNRLAFWTGVLAGATLLLVLATAALVFVESHAEPPQVVVAPSPPQLSRPVVVTPLPPTPSMPTRR